MIQPDGQYAMLDPEVLRFATAPPALPPDAPPGTILAFGTEDEIAAIAARVRLGDAELDARRRRRKAQRAARRHNR